jgi:hypothetical protein
MRPERIAAATVAAFAAVLLAVPALADDPSPSASPTTSVEVDDATLRWGINNETSNRAFAPNTYNFMSAGKVPDPGHGGSVIAQSDWKQSSGNVEIEKWDGSAWKPATWAGLKTDAAGNPLGSATAGTFSGHTFVLSGGVGTVDREAGTAHVAWDADLTVLYYSGMSFFYVSDPVLDVADGVGTLTATVSGFGSSLSDPDSWVPVAPRTVTFADLPAVDLDDEAGFVAEPAYRGVQVTGVPQNTTGTDAGSFPQSWIDMMDDLGTAAFWYSSGGATDPFKVALPMTVGYDASVPVVGPTPTIAPTKDPIENEIKESPTPAPTVTATVTAPAAPVAAPAVVPPAVAPPPVVATPAATAYAPVPQPATQVALAAAPTATGSSDGGPSSLPWWLGSGCLLAAALVLLVPVGGSGPGNRSIQK